MRVVTKGLASTRTPQDVPKAFRFHGFSLNWTPRWGAAQPLLCDCSDRNPCLEMVSNSSGLTCKKSILAATFFWEGSGSLESQSPANLKQLQKPSAPKSARGQLKGSRPKKKQAACSSATLSNLRVVLVPKTLRFVMTSWGPYHDFLRV